MLKVDEIWAWPVASTLTTLLDAVAFFAIIHQFLLGRFLLVGDSLLLTLPRTGVVLGALTTDRETDTMTDPAIATDVHQSLDVHLDGRTELTLNLVFLIDEVTDKCHLLIVPVSDLDVVVDTALVEDFPGAAAADTINVGEAYLTTFVVR